MSGGKLRHLGVQFGFHFSHHSLVYLQDIFPYPQFFLSFQGCLLKRKCFFLFQAHLLLVIPYGLAIHHHPIKKIGSVLQIPHQPVLF